MTSNVSLEFKEHNFRSHIFVKECSRSVASPHAKVLITAHVSLRRGECCPAEGSVPITNPQNLERFFQKYLAHRVEGLGFVFSWLCFATVGGCPCMWCFG